MPLISSDALFEKMTQGLVRNGVSQTNALSVARALCQAQIDGQGGHGVSRICSYAAQAASGKVDGQATPRIATQQGGVVHIDAADGFAYPALDLAIQTLAILTPQQGIACAGIFNSHHFGVAGRTVERLAENGLIGIICGNAPAAMAPWGGSSPLFGTNPLAFACPRIEHEPLVIDLSLSEVARGKVMLAAKEGRDVPISWGKDASGQPTHDPHKIIGGGTMTPMGGAKGAALALMVEILSSALIGANFSKDATSFFDAEGPPPRVGQLILAIDPEAFGGQQFQARVETLLSLVLEQNGTRLPGTTRMENRKLPEVQLSEALLNDLNSLSD